MPVSGVIAKGITLKVLRLAGDPTNPVTDVVVVSKAYKSLQLAPVDPLQPTCPLGPVAPKGPYSPVGPTGP